MMESEVMTMIMWGVALIWVAIVMFVVLMLRHRLLVEPRAPEPTGAATPVPPVSFLVPARNEAHRVLRESLGSMLAQDYPDFEIIAVDDCSTDHTLDILKDMAAGDSRLRVIEGKEPPPGWVLGKQYALQQAVQMARGRWLVTADSDLILHPAAIRSAVGYAEQRQIDVLAIEVHLDCESFWEKLVVPTNGLLALLARTHQWANDPKNPRAFSNGGFLLIGRAALERMGGFESIKDQVPGGMALACRLKQTGNRFRLVETLSLVRTRGYATIREMWEGFGKGAIAPGSKMAYALTVTVLGVLLMVLPAVVLISSWLIPALMVVVLPAGLAYAMMVGVHVKMCRHAGVPWPYAFLMPLAYVILIVALLGAAWNLITGRGVEWKGRRIRVEKQSTKCVESSFMHRSN
jgi:chlorobactene glucosyltransferase